VDKIMLVLVEICFLKEFYAGGICELMFIHSIFAYHIIQIIVLRKPNFHGLLVFTPKKRLSLD
jgi:hypothetical protein